MALPRTKGHLGTADGKPITAWLILGPSGVGKSDFGRWLAAERNWLHLEIDQCPKDGIDLYDLRAEWDDFYYRGNPDGLGEALRRRLEKTSSARAVLTFPGNLVLCPDVMVTGTQAGIRTIYLYGSEANCIAAFLAREEKSGRNLGRDHWTANNQNLYARISEPAFAPYKNHVFTRAGARRPHAEVFEALLKGEGSE